jgi:2-succinyl-5-enolpyruvyl-6-hydroxy-3-cyclohexene-1-carboxylate synthase
LLAARAVEASVVFVVLDNDGGGIFHFLPSGTVPEVDQLFTTPTGIDPIELAQAYGVDARRVERASQVIPAVESAVASGGVHVVVVPTDRRTNLQRHESLWNQVTA